MNKNLLRSVAFVLALVAGRAQAQSAALDQSDASQVRRQLLASATPAESYAGESDDLGVQTPLLTHPRRQLFRVSGDVQYYFTDNLFNAKEKHSSDALVSTLEAAFAPDSYALAGGQLAPRLGFRHEWYNYALLNDDTIRMADLFTGAITHPRVSIFDFTAQTAFSDLTWSRANWAFSAGYDFRRLISDRTDDEFYREHVLHWGVQRWIPIDDRSGVSLAYLGDYRLTHALIFPPTFPLAKLLHPDANDRTDHSLLASYTHQVGSAGELTPYYRFQFTEYTSNLDRRDELHSLGLMFTWHFCPCSAVRVFTSYDARSSSATDLGFQKFSAGLGFNLTFRF